MSRSKFLFYYLISLLHLSASPKLLSAWSHEGFGPRANALAGAGVSSFLDGFSAFHNPAALAADEDEESTFSYALQAGKSSFFPIQSIVTKNYFTGGKEEPLSEELPSSPLQFSQLLAMRSMLFPHFNRLSLGLTVQAPLSVLAAMDTGNLYVPRYARFSNRQLLPEIYLGLGFALTQGFYAGLGSSISARLKGSCDIHLSTPNETTSHHRIQGFLIPALAPYLSLYYERPKQVDDLHFSTGLVLRAPRKIHSRLNVQATTAINMVGAAIPLDLEEMFETKPWTLEWGIRLGVCSWLDAFLQLDYQAWGHPGSGIVPWTTRLSNQKDKPTTLVVQSTRDETISYRNLLIPRLAFLFHVSDSNQARLGMSYRASMLGALPTGIGNTLDPPSWLFAVGWSHVATNFAKRFPLEIDASLGLQWLQSQTIHKSSGDEAGNLSFRKIGAPHYRAGGCHWTATIAVKIPFQIGLRSQTGVTL